ncbi:MAG: SPOR domain-containing protein [Acidobacteriota bacterium]
MANPNIREIQVSAKQLVFLFMASVVLAVAVFLLGVSVGRGVRDKTGGAPTPMTESAANATPSAPLGPVPPPTEMPPLKYPELSKGDGSTVGGSSAKAETPQGLPPSADVPDVSEPAAPVAKEPKAATPAPVVPKPDTAKPVAKPAELPASPKSGSGWSVQINAFRSRENADKQVAALKTKGYPAFVAPAQTGGLFRVRVGPYPERAEADRTAGKLKQEGFTPSVIR